MAVISLDELKARAEAMRRAGASMAEISRAVGRSPSTIHLWAAQGGWRIMDLEVEGLAPLPEGSPPLPLMAEDQRKLRGSFRLPKVEDPSGSSGWGGEMNANAQTPPTPTPPHQGEGKENGRPSEQLSPQARDRAPDSLVIPAPPGAAGETSDGAGAGARMECAQGWGESGSELSPLEAAKALHQRSAELGQAGQIRAAEAAARLAERILRTEAQLLRIDIAHPEPDPEGQEEWPGGARAELARRFARIRELHAEQLAQDPDWTPEASGAASEADRFVFSLFR